MDNTIVNNITKIALSNKLSLLFTNDIDYSSIAGNTISIGYYENSELLLISFFHELGHFLDKTDWSINANKHTKYYAERNAWIVGLKEAKKYNYNFSFSSYRWAISQLNTYYA